MLLAIDIGNTNIVMGLFDGKNLVGNTRLSTPALLTADEARTLAESFVRQEKGRDKNVRKVAISSVVPHLTGAFTTSCQAAFGCRAIVVSYDISLPVAIDIDYPEQIGADRIANTVAAYAEYGGPAIIVDLGTAVTFDVINADGAYVGGVIVPGPETSMAQLARNAARLFEVQFEPPGAVVGRSTEAALKSGLFYGTVGQVDYIIDRIIEEIGFEGGRILATGGLAAGLERHSRHIELVVPELTLEGLRLIAELN